MIYIRDAFIFSMLADLLLLCGTGCASLAFDSWMPMQIGLTFTSTTFLIAAIAVLPLVWINIRTAIGDKNEGK
jgi:hypothetical protein